MQRNAILLKLQLLGDFVPQIPLLVGSTNFVTLFSRAPATQKWGLKALPPENI